MIDCWPLLLRLVADAYPLICPPASVASSEICQPLEPGSWFSVTIGLSAAVAFILKAWINADADRLATPNAAARRMKSRRLILPSI